MILLNLTPTQIAELVLIILMASLAMVGFIAFMSKITYPWKHDMDIRRERLRLKGHDVSHIRDFGTLKNKNKS